MIGFRLVDVSMARLVSGFVPRSATTIVILIFLVLLFLSYTVKSPSAGGRIRSSGSQADLALIKNHTLGFGKIFVINLPQRTDHRDAISLAAHLSDLDVEFVDGVARVDNKTLPPGGARLGLKPGHLGNWRAHVDVARLIVEQRLSSGLVLEDDADWDVHIKAQLRDFARASRLLIQPLPGTADEYLDPTYSDPSGADEPSEFDISKYTTFPASSSPYGDLNRWDLLWLGHCGCRFPSTDDPHTSLGRAIIPNDTTVPLPKHLDMEFGSKELPTEYPPHTRVVSHASTNTCTLGYALSLAGARRLLYELGVHQMTGTTDMQLRSFCQGTDGRTARRCLTVQPQLFQHHRPVGAASSFSDIDAHKERYNGKAYTLNVRWSVRINFGRLVDGRTDYVDSYPDD